MQKHLHSSLCAVQKWSSNEIVKAKMTVQVTISMRNGGFHQHGGGEAIIISRTDVEFVHDWAWKNACLRDFLLIRTVKETGLRTNELAHLRGQDFDFETGWFKVLDSKKHKYYDEIIDAVTLELIHELIGDRQDYIFVHKKNWEPWKNQPLSKVAIWKIVKKTARLSGIKAWREFTPRLLRHYFACWYMYEDESIGKKPGNIEFLRRRLRHKNPGMTHTYLARLFFKEDEKKEYDRMQRLPFTGDSNPHLYLDPNRETICNGCGNLALCKFQPLPSCVSVCKFKVEKKEMIEK
jgi:hypothetical protein